MSASSADGLATYIRLSSVTREGAIPNVSASSMAVVRARWAGLVTICCGTWPCFARYAPMAGASRMPREFSGRSKSPSSGWSQLDFACRARYRRFTWVCSHYGRACRRRPDLLRCKAFRVECADCTSARNNAAMRKARRLPGRAAPRMARACVAHRLFGPAKPRSSRLGSHPFDGSGDYALHRVNRP